MDHATFIDPELTRPDLLVLKSLLKDIEGHNAGPDSGYASASDSQVEEGQNDHAQDSTLRPRTKVHSSSTEPDSSPLSDEDQALVTFLKSLNNPKAEQFEPTVFMSWDLPTLRLPSFIKTHLLQPYISFAKTIVRKEIDVVMLTHLIIYFTTSIPSALMLFRHFTYTHGVLHLAMQGWYIGTYTLMMHQHIHMGGILAPRYALLDAIFPYITDPLHGHTWNSYYFHHVKHHHVEGNGPDDLSSTIRYQRDSPIHFLHYVARFAFLIWFDLPRYFVRKGKPLMAFKIAVCEIGNLLAIAFLARYVAFKPTLFAFILPLCAVRIGLMVGNWGQHALVDEIDPNSELRSSITLIDVPSNRYCYNDGYHTSHHLNPKRHWRDHPVAFLAAKQKYTQERALVFRNIDYIMLTVCLLKKDYARIARCLVPLGKEQASWTMEQREAMLRTKTKAFTQQDIDAKWKKNAATISCIDADITADTKYLNTPNTTTTTTVAA